MLPPELPKRGTRQFYSARSGTSKAGGHYSLQQLLKHFAVICKDLGRCGYFDEAFGYSCVDRGEIEGYLGSDIAEEISLRLGKEGLWPVNKNLKNYTEEDLFDVMEFIHDHASKPMKGEYHSWSDCGWHFSEFDKSAGQSAYKDRINSILCQYGDGYYVSEKGEINHLGDDGVRSLLDAEVPKTNKRNVENKIELAKEKFRRYKSTLDDRREAVRILADVLEYLRPRIKSVLTAKDEADLFNIANNFAIRHHNEKQKTNYDENIWLSWMFYYYLATLHAVLRFIAKKSGSGKK